MVNLFTAHRQFKKVRFQFMHQYFTDPNVDLFENINKYIKDRNNPKFLVVVVPKEWLDDYNLLVLDIDMNDFDYKILGFTETFTIKSKNKNITFIPCSISVNDLKHEYLITPVYDISIGLDDIYRELEPILFNPCNFLKKSDINPFEISTLFHK